jgi:glyoxylase I family protein
MKLEHFALQVPDPVAMAQWYVNHLGFSVARSGGEPTHARFLLEGAGSVMIEIYRNPAAPVPNYQTMNPLLLHLAIVSDDPAADRDRLVTAGATVAEDLTTTPAGDAFVMLRDPWGVALQLIRRKVPMLPSRA